MLCNLSPKESNWSISVDWSGRIGDVAAASRWIRQKVEAMVEFADKRIAHMDPRCERIDLAYSIGDLLPAACRC